MGDNAEEGDGKVVATNPVVKGDERDELNERSQHAFTFGKRGVDARRTSARG